MIIIVIIIFHIIYTDIHFTHRAQTTHVIIITEQT